MSWWTYVTRTSGTESPKVMANKTGIDGPNFSKWKSGQIPGPQIVATFARAYGRPVLEAFVAADFLTAEEAKQRPAAAPSLSSLTEVELLEEVLDRLKRGEAHGERDPAPMRSAARRGGATQAERETATEEGQRHRPKTGENPRRKKDEDPLTPGETA